MAFQRLQIERCEWSEQREEGPELMTMQYLFKSGVFQIQRGSFLLFTTFTPSPPAGGSNWNSRMKLLVSVLLFCSFLVNSRLCRQSPQEDEDFLPVSTSKSIYSCLKRNKLRNQSFSKYVTVQHLIQLDDKNKKRTQHYFSPHQATIVST
jgi:hypothetical protein